MNVFFYNVAIICAASNYHHQPYHGINRVSNTWTYNLIWSIWLREGYLCTCPFIVLLDRVSNWSSIKITSLQTSTNLLEHVDERNMEIWKCKLVCGTHRTLCLPNYLIYDTHHNHRGLELDCTLLRSWTNLKWWMSSHKHSQVTKSISQGVCFYHPHSFKTV